MWFHDFITLNEIVIYFYTCLGHLIALSWCICNASWCICNASCCTSYFRILLLASCSYVVDLQSLRIVFHLIRPISTCMGAKIGKIGSFTAFSNRSSISQILSSFFRPLLHTMLCMFFVFGVTYVSLKYKTKLISVRAQTIPLIIVCVCYVSGILGYALSLCSYLNS